MRTAIRTLDEVRRALEDLSSECLTKSRTVSGNEAERLRAIVQSAERAREQVKDITIKVAEYITYCLKNDPIHDLPEDP